MKLHLLSNTLCASPELLTLLEQVSGEWINKDEAYTITFKDPDYSPTAGGYHPVEIRIEKDRDITYITDFSYAGTPPFVELAKCLDFDFGCQRLQCYDTEFPLDHCNEIFDLWQKNFCTYWRMGVYKIDISGD